MGQNTSDQSTAHFTYIRIRIMKFTVVLIYSLMAMISAETMVDVDLEEMSIHQELSDDKGTYTGEYTFTSPEGEQYYVKYIADEDGFRVLESNAIPVSANNIAADGNQGSFISEEDDVI